MSSSPYHVTEHTIQASHIRDFARATAASQDETLLLAVKQYVPKDNPSPQRGDLTVIGAHANGFPKELYEPLWDEFYHEAKKRGIRIRSIYIADAAWQGRSGVLNEGKLGNDPGWNDYARDIVHLVNHFRPPRPLLAVGHSFGANALTNAALLHPRLFSAGLVLLDPVIAHFDCTPFTLRNGPAALSVNRRDVWPSREEAAASFRRSKFYQAWDPRVLDRWIEFGLRDVPASSAEKGHQGSQGTSRPVTLSTTKHQEVFTFLRPSWPAYNADGTEIIHQERCPDLDDNLDPSVSNWPLYRAEGGNTMVRLPSVRPGVLFVIGGQSVTTPADAVRERTVITGTGTGGSGGAAKSRVKQVTHPDHGHLIPMEAPAYCARHAADWAAGELERWWAEEKEYEEWTKKPLSEKTTISDEYRRYLGVQDRNGAKAQPKPKI
ncbi:prolyl aminopeptidase [Purpureocillium lavendulum]|uniref:Prolyl aminopeptidase n=1 Tax=Purpureocillium lavendulum TaxID=1247861 RepID=A0AB34FS77_9HYPO|nr:prolyl aminopeptidase [Purpureocillium lavendulum]